MEMRIGSLCFERNFLSATFDDGPIVKFTRTESRLLKFMTENPERVLSRDQLLSSAGDLDSERLDRSIDFLINRLRRKLRDDPKNPTYIATRYGEGYIWLNASALKSPLAMGAHAIVGPVIGLHHLGKRSGDARAFSSLFHRSFAEHFSDELSIVFDPDCPPVEAFGNDAPEIGITLHFLLEKDQLECVFRGVYFRTGRTFFVNRRVIQNNGDDPVSGESVAADIIGQMRIGLAEKPQTDVPLSVGMIDSGTQFTGLKGHWSEHDQPLRDRVAQNPRDFRAKVMLATNIHTKYLQDSVQIFSSNQDPRKQDEDEIEQLVVESLPHLEKDASYLIVIAKLLFFIDRGYSEMAVELGERAHQQSTSPAATLPVIGQMRVFTGNNVDGLAAINQALDLCEAGTQFEIYLLILKCEALAAVADRSNLQMVLSRVCQFVPQIKVLMEVLFTDPDNPSKAAQQALVNMPPPQAKGMLMFMHYVYGRLLQQADHRANAYRTPVTLFTKQFGPQIIPQEVDMLL